MTSESRISQWILLRLAPINSSVCKPEHIDIAISANVKAIYFLMDNLENCGP
jgi:hypothetical protein